MFRTGGRWLRNILVASIVMAFLFEESVAQEDDGEPATNLSLIQKLSREVADSVRTYVRVGDSVSVAIRPKETAWYVASVMVQSMIDGGRIPTESLSAPYEIDFGLLNARVTYGNTRRNAFFGSKILDRKVSIEFNTKVVHRMTGSILFNGNVSRFASDTIEVGDVDKVESAGIPATHGVLPGEGFFSTMLEPLVALGTIAVAVYLLFHVRS